MDIEQIIQNSKFDDEEIRYLLEKNRDIIDMFLNLWYEFISSSSFFSDTYPDNIHTREYVPYEKNSRIFKAQRYQTEWRKIYILIFRKYLEGMKKHQWTRIYLELFI